MTILSAAMVHVQLFTTDGVNSHIQSFEVMPTHNKSLYLLDKLSNKVVYTSHIYLGNRKMYITMRSYVVKKS